jgi:hypothetical protein
VHRLVVALTTVLGLTAATVVVIYLLLSGVAPDQAARLAPADAAVYVNIYLQPSSGQAGKLAALASRLPGFADASALDTKIGQVAENLLSQAGIDYRADVEPWLGSQLALAFEASDLNASEPMAVLFAAVKDRPAAEAALARLLPEGRVADYEGVPIRVGADATLAVLDDIFVAAPTRERVEAVIDVERGAPALANDAGFRRAMDRLPPDHVATVYVDIARLTGAAAATGEAGLAAAGALIVEETGLRLVGGIPFGDGGASPLPPNAERASLAEWMPPDTEAEVVLVGVRAALEAAEAGRLPGGEALAELLATVRAVAAFGLGIDVERDLLPLLDGEVGVAVSGLGEAEPAVLLLMKPSDTGGTSTLMAALAERLADAGGRIETRRAGGAEITIVDAPELGTVAFAIVDGVVVAGLAPDTVAAALEAREGARGLAASPGYDDAFALAGEHAGNEAWVDVAGLIAATGIADTLAADARDILQQIGALAVAAPSRTDAIEIRAALTVE